MKKLLLILVLALLPLQFTWAAAAAYCQHEGEKTTQHFGHHAQQKDFVSETPSSHAQKKNLDIIASFTG